MLFYNQNMQLLIKKKNSVQLNSKILRTKCKIFPFNYKFYAKINKILFKMKFKANV